MSTSAVAQDQLPGPSSQGSGRVERWIEDQRGEDQDPHLLSPMPRHSDTILHSRRLTPVTPRSPARRQDISDFVFVDDDDEVSTRITPESNSSLSTGVLLPPFTRWKQIPNGTERNQRSPSHSGRTSGLFGNASSPLKNWRVSFTPSIRRASAGNHSRGSSLPTFNTPSPNTPEKSDGTKRSTSPWKAKFQRPERNGSFRIHRRI
jgi:hypothetical protein